MNLFTRLALWWLMRQGGTLEIRRVTLNEKRPGVSGTRLGSYTNLPEALALFGPLLVIDPQVRLTLSLRFLIDSKSLAPRRDPLAEFIARPFVPDRTLGITTAEIADNAVTAANPTLHVCDAEGPLVFEGGEYVPSCSGCGKPYAPEQLTL